MTKLNFIGLGVAGNFAGHLEQAGEAVDFIHVKTTENVQPKAIFPFYVNSQTLPEETRFLAQYPLSDSVLSFPQNADNLQIEPEIALICRIHYENDKVKALLPTHFAAYNDCSIRRPNACKISEKKNWGADSKGLSANWIPLDKFTTSGNIDQYSIACFHKRNGIITEYGVNSEAVGYSYFHQKLIDWIIDRMNNQPDKGPMNNIAELIHQAGYPDTAIISIGSTRYTPFGETHYLQVGDTSFVVLYNHNTYRPTDIKTMVEQELFNQDISALVQKVM